MSQGTIEASHFSPDTAEFIRLLNKHGVKYVIVGGEAVIYYGFARLTGDVDFFYDSGPNNVKSLFRALTEFWDGSVPGIEKSEELMEEGLILQFGQVSLRSNVVLPLRVQRLEAIVDAVISLGSVKIDRQHFQFQRVLNQVNLLPEAGHPERQVVHARQHVEAFHM